MFFAVFVDAFLEILLALLWVVPHGYKSQAEPPKLSGPLDHVHAALLRPLGKEMLKSHSFSS